MNAPEFHLTAAAQNPMMHNITFDELTLGQTARLVRTLSQTDIQTFAAVSGDVNPAHLDPEYAQGTRFHGVIAHGMWGGALISSVLGNEFPGPGTIYLEQTLKFKRPVRIGDTLTIVLTVTDKQAETGQVKLDCEAVNQNGETVISGLATVLAPKHKIERPRPALPEVQLFDPEARLGAWLDGLTLGAPMPCAVVHPCDIESLQGALLAAKRGLITPILVGPEARIQALAQQHGLDISAYRLEAAPHSHAAAERAVALAVSGEARMLMKGSLHTDELMHAVIKEPALRTGRRLSHVFRFDIPSYPKPLLLTDAAINIAPGLEDKADIVRNVIELAHALGVPCPKIALLSAVETVTEKIASTLDAAALCKMAQRGQITGGLLDGPLAFDNAVSLEAARIKGIDSPVAGDADVLVVPDLESGNMLAKLLQYMAGASTCGLVVGARVPIALTSRADGANSRMASAALGVVLALAQAARQNPSLV
ncbi:bifunctional enoyl-CoA hydratase/phosphate acetyltransferase [Roseateles koreensis]|uniref:Bifunctional enoyl-CoA hydratase/phosphate acetyltransferase n=1 Tax=Roseateles koreensis TaxID=2987526 RepID=A0ABT5KMQ4_9BURK|nr:bifunctional enoyl-CoA hydratase/phosphate acetyltransferase [Roseateles koreensis]MDC8784196.1 bifunctional enoyl-CoA hydratase/phosphate acetyltransferase [Roseateles koreensis]